MARSFPVMLRNVEARKRCRPFIALWDYSRADKKFTVILRIFVKTRKCTQQSMLILIKSCIKTDVYSSLRIILHHNLIIS